VDFRVLGPLEVLRDGRPVVVVAPKQRTLLAVLLLHANEVVSRARLVDELWGEHPPATAVKTLHVYVSQLRKALGGDTIVTHGQGYLAHVDADALDASRFRSLLADARRLHREERTADADEAYLGALALWRGDALSDVVLEARGRHEAEGLDELRLAATEEWIDCELALGRHAQVVAELERLVEGTPYRERLREQLMLALYRSGRQADALAAYRDARRVLVDELGIEPTQRLQALERAILRHDPELDPPRGTRAREPTRRSRTVALVALVVATALLAAVVVAVWQLRASPAAAHALALAGNSVAMIDPATNGVADEIPIGGRPGGIAVADGSVWVGNRDDHTLLRIDAGSRKVVRTIGLGTEPVGITAGAGDVWVVTEPNGTVVRVDPALNDVVARINVPQGRNICCPAELLYGGRAAWLSRYGKLVRIDPATNSATALGSVDAWIGSFAYGDRALWVVSGVEGRRLDRVDPRTGAVTERWRFERVGRTGGLSWAFPADGAIWIGALWDTTMWKVDTDTGRLVGNVDLGRVPAWPAFGGGSFWFATTDRNLVRVDPSSEPPVTTIPLGVYPSAVEVGAGAVWIATSSP
jgi:YVTN family beta-propeller protein